MPPFTENHALFFRTDHFADPATINGATVNGVFTDAYVDDEDLEIEGVLPTFQCPTADVASAVYGDVATIKGTAYKIRSKKTDGTGQTVLVLEAP